MGKGSFSSCLQPIWGDFNYTYINLSSDSRLLVQSIIHPCVHPDVFIIFRPGTAQAIARSLICVQGSYRFWASWSLLSLHSQFLSFCPSSSYSYNHTYSGFYFSYQFVKVAITKISIVKAYLAVVLSDLAPLLIQIINSLRIISSVSSWFFRLNIEEILNLQQYQIEYQARSLTGSFYLEI